MTPTGRWAPSPTGDLHLGNLRTALLAWLFARRAGGRFVWRFEDLDGAVRPKYYDTQLADLAALGLNWDGTPWRQSERLDVYRDVIAELERRDLTYPCWCTRREIREAASAPHGVGEGAYPGTCRNLSAADRSARTASGRPPALRLRSDGREVAMVDGQLGAYRGTVDDVVLRRGDGTPAYNLVVVIDDDAQGVTEVVRGDDLLSSTPRQIHLAELLGLRVPQYRHVPLAVNSEGARLAKRHGAVTLADRRARGESALDVLNLLLTSLELPAVDSLSNLNNVVDAFDPATLPTTPWTLRNLDG